MRSTRETLNKAMLQGIVPESYVEPTLTIIFVDTDGCVVSGVVTHHELRTTTHFDPIKRVTKLMAIERKEVRSESVLQTGGKDSNEVSD